MILLTENIDPSVLIASGKAGIDPALGQMIEHRDFFGAADGVPGRQDEAEWGEPNTLRACREIRVEHQRRNGTLISFGVEMVLRGRHDIEAGVVREHSELAQLFEHHLIAIVVASNRSQTLPFLKRGGNGGQHKKHELHGPLPFLVSPSR